MTKNEAKTATTVSIILMFLFTGLQSQLGSNDTQIFGVFTMISLVVAVISYRRWKHAEA